MKRNDEERRQWIVNDEGLYNWFQSEHRRYKGPTMREFIRQNRAHMEDKWANRHIHN